MTLGKNIKYAIALLAGSCACSWAQAKRALPPAESDSAVYAGTVVDATTGVNIPGASIAACRETNPPSSSCWKTNTDATGRFSLRIPFVQTDDYVVTASKEGYIEPSRYQRRAVEYHQDGKRTLLKQAVLQLLALATVSGDVFDAHGQPAVNALIELRSPSGLTRSTVATTDYQGHFRFQVFPSSYSVCAKPEYEVNRGWKVPTLPMSVVPASTCFSSVPGSEVASVLQLKPGESIDPLRISLGEKKAYTVRGRIKTRVTKTGNWTESVWAIANSPRPLEVGAELPEYDQFPGYVDERSGMFLIHGLTAGTYTILARSGPASQDDTGPLPPEFNAWQRIRFGPSASAIVLTIRPHVTVTGRVVLQGYDAKSPPTAFLDSGLPSYFSFSGMSAGTDSGGRFRISGVSPGRYNVKVYGGEDATYISGLRQDGREIAGGSVRIENGRTTDWRCGFENRPQRSRSSSWEIYRTIPVVIFAPQPFHKTRGTGVMSGSGVALPRLE